MNEPLITGGYILLSRKLIESKIMKKPPLYLKVWVWLLLKAQHEPYKGLDRGEWMTSVSEIQEAMSWMVGYRKTTPTYKQIRNVLDWLRNPCEGNTNSNTKDGMIDTTKGTHGIKIKILNYDFYQDPKNYEGHNERQRKGTSKEARWATQGHNINKNVKNEKNEEEISKGNFSELSKAKIEEWLTYKKERKETYKPTGLKSLLTQIENNISTYGEQKVIDLISECMAAGYKGIIWDKLKKPQYKQNKRSNRNNFEQRDYSDDFYDKLQDIK